MTDNYKKYKKIANLPQKALKKSFNKISGWKPENKLWQAVRVPGATVAFNLYLAMLLFTRIGLENPIIEKLGNMNANKKIENTPKTKFGHFINKIKKHQKKNPTASAFLVYYFMLLSFLGAGKVAHDFMNETEKEKVEIKQYKPKQTKQEPKQEKQSTFATYKKKLHPITPWLIAQLIAVEGVKMENGMHIPYKDGNGIWTIGFGSTYLKDGSRVTKNTPPITTEEAYDLARWHIEENETYFDLYCYSVADKNLVVRDTGEAFGLSSIVYNSGTKFIENKNDSNHRKRFALLREEYEKYGEKIPDSVVKKAFEKYPIVNKESFGKAWIDSHKAQDMANAIGLYMKDGAGMHWRRWLEAGLITGDIDPQDLLECPIKGMTDFYIYIGGGKKQKGKYALWEKTKDGLTPIKSTYAAFKEWLTQPQRLDLVGDSLIQIEREKVKDFMPKEIVISCLKGKCEIGTTQKKKLKSKSKTIAFNNGILNIKNKLNQQDGAMIYPFDNEYNKA